MILWDFKLLYVFFHFCSAAWDLRFRFRSFFFASALGIINMGLLCGIVGLLYIHSPLWNHGSPVHSPSWNRLICCCSLCSEEGWKQFSMNQVCVLSFPLLTLFMNTLPLSFLGLIREKELVFEFEEIK